MENLPVNSNTYLDVSSEARDRLRERGVTDPAQQDAFFQRSAELLRDALELDDRLNAEERIALQSASRGAPSEPLD